MKSRVANGTVHRSELSVTRRYKFCAAHFLPLVPDGHKCKNEHGHNYRVEVTIAGDRDRVGFIIDFWDLDKIVDPILALVDHAGMLNKIDGLSNPTAEIIAEWFFAKISAELDKIDEGPRALTERVWLQKVTIFEEDDCWASFTDIT